LVIFRLITYSKSMRYKPLKDIKEGKRLKEIKTTTKSSKK
jgi:hypothetical protein